MNLKPTDIDQAIAQINGLADGCTNLLSRLHEHDQGWNAYMNWAYETERMLRNTFADPEIVNGAYTERYWHLAAGGNARMPQMITAEVRVQEERLRGLIATLGHEQMNLTGNIASPRSSTVTGSVSRPGRPRSCRWRARRPHRPSHRRV
jgi:hypothetical protein